MVLETVKYTSYKGCPDSLAFERKEDQFLVGQSWRVVGSMISDFRRFGVLSDFYAWLHELRECDIWEFRNRHLEILFQRQPIMNR